MKKFDFIYSKYLKPICDSSPIAVAELKSAVLCSNIQGTIFFHALHDNCGVFVTSVFFGLPENKWYEICISFDKKMHPRERSRRCIGSCHDTQIISSVYGNDGCAFSLQFSEAFDKTALIGHSVFLKEKASISPNDHFEKLACGLIMPLS